MSANNIELRNNTQDDPMARVETIKLVFFDAENDRLVKVHEAPVNPSQDGTYNWTVKLQKGEYKLLIAANFPERFKDLLNPGKQLTEVTANLKYAITGFTSAKENDGFYHSAAIPMFNSQGLVTISEANFSTEAEALSVMIEPLYARVIVVGEPKAKDGFIPKDAQTRYFIANTEEYMSLLRVLAPLANGNMEEIGDLSTLKDRYAKSPSYELEYLSESKGKQYHYITQKEFDTYSLPVQRTYADNDLTYTSMYQRELTLKKGAVKVGEAPHVAIAQVWIPSNIGINDESADRTWFSFNGNYMSRAKFKEYVVSSETGKNIPIYGLKDAIVTSGIKSSDVDKFKAFEKNGIRCYDQGVNYYAVPIRHFLDDVAPQDDSYGRYGIVRGNEYRFSLQSVSAAGSPILVDLSNDNTELKQLVPSSGAISISQLEVREIPVDL